MIWKKRNVAQLVFSLKKTEKYILIFRIFFDEETQFPSLRECIRIDRNLHIQLQFNGNPIPLPQWFINGHNAKLTRFSMLENFPQYMQNVVNEHPNLILKELQKNQYFKPNLYILEGHVHINS